MNENDLIKDAREEFICLHVNEFTIESYKDFQENFFKAENGGQTIIPVYIDSTGGEVFTLFAMIDLFRSSKLPICTIAIGRAQSCGADLLAAGTSGYRYASPLASIMVHEGEAGYVGKLADVKVQAEEELKIIKTTFEILDKNCNQKQGYWNQLLKDKLNTDLYMTADEAKMHGIVDFVRLPRFEPQVAMKTRIV